MLKGIVFAIVACLIWGLIFVIPELIKDFSILEIVLGRYFFYGMISVFFLLKNISFGKFRYSLSIWKMAIFYSLLSTVGYYSCVVMALKYTPPSICALILGISPITISFYGNWRQKECSYKSLFIPSLLVLIGLCIMNLPHLSESTSLSKDLFGLSCSLIALTIWSWFAVANARFLKLYSHVTMSDWTTLMGVAALFWVAIFGAILWFFYGEATTINKYFTWSQGLGDFLMGTAILGLFCSWLANYLWNKASQHLPISIAGQLLIFETIFGLIFICCIQHRFPPKLECLGIGLFLLAIFIGIRSMAKLAKEPHSI